MKAEDTAEAYVLLAVKQIAVNVAVLKLKKVAYGNFKKPRLRFYKVVFRLLNALQTNLSPLISREF